VLAALGFAYTVQAGLATATGRRQPDYALVLGDDRRAEADRLEGGARYGLAGRGGRRQAVRSAARRPWHWW
jgi:hypothetical protein